MRSSVAGSRRSRWNTGDLVVVMGGALMGLALVAGSMSSARWVLVLAFAFAAVIAVATLGVTRRAFLAVVLMDLALQLDVHLFYRDEAVLLGMRGGFNVSLTLLCLPVLYALWFGERRADPHEGDREWELPTILLAVYLGLSALSGITAGDRANAVFDLSIMVPAFLLHLYLANRTKDEGDLLFVLSLLLIGLVVQSTFMIVPSALGQSLDFVPGLSSTMADNTNVSLAIQRAEGTFGSPIVAASYLVLLIAPAAGLFLSSAPRKLTVLAAAAVPAGGIALVLTLSRAAWATGLLSLMILAVVALFRRWLSPRLVLAALVLAALALLPFLDVVVTRLTAPDAGSAYSRLPLMRIALDVIREHPLIGVGINNLPLVMGEYRVIDYGGTWLFQVHNKYLLVWAETGTFGLLAFLGFLGTSFWTGWRIVALRHPLWSPVALGVVGALTAHALHMLVDSFTARGQVQLLWVLSAVLVSMLRIAREDVRAAGEGPEAGRPS